MSITRTSSLILAAGVIAGATSVSSAAFSGLIAVEVTDENPTVRISVSDYFSASDPTTSGTFPAEITWQVMILNGQGFDIGRVALRMNEFPGEDYGGAFGDIVFVNPNDVPDGFNGTPVLNVTDAPTNGDVDSIFSVDALEFSDDTGFLADDQRLDVVFSGSAPHALGDELLYEFTIFNPNLNIYDFSFEFFPVPAPGVVTLAGLGMLGFSTRRRA